MRYSSGGTSQVPVSRCNRSLPPWEVRRNPAGPVLWGRPHTGHLSPSPVHPACADRCSYKLLGCMDSFTPTSTFQYLPQSTKGKTQIQHLFQTANPTGPVDVSSWVTAPASRRPQGLGQAPGEMPPCLMFSDFLLLKHVHIHPSTAAPFAGLGSPDMRGYWARG